MSSSISTDIRFQRIAEAKEVLCSCIIFNIHDKKSQETRTFVLDYITNDFTNLADVINQYLCNGNKSGKVRGYGTENVLKDTDFHNKKVLYYNETTAYFWDPVACAPADTLPSCFCDYEMPTKPLRSMLEQFAEHLAINEPEDSTLFQKCIFTPDENIKERLDKFEHLKCFFDLVESNYFDKNLFLSIKIIFI